MKVSGKGGRRFFSKRLSGTGGETTPQTKDSVFYGMGKKAWRRLREHEAGKGFEAICRERPGANRFTDGKRNTGGGVGVVGWGLGGGCWRYRSSLELSPIRVSLKMRSSVPTVAWEKRAGTQRGEKTENTWTCW